MQIQVSNLTFGYEDSSDYVFDNISFSIDTNWKLGFIGRNGKGKTTLFHLLMGKFPYQGSIKTTTVFDYFPYYISDEMLKENASSFLEMLKPGCEEWRVICEMGKLGVDADLLYRPFESLSHGERTKVLLALLFSQENDFLLIDEPTNHLDKEARESVRNYLQEKKGYILVSHDRELLDACVDHVLALNRKTIEVSAGNFSTWWENKQRKDMFAQSENQKHLQEIGNLKKSVEQSNRWAAQNESTKIGFDPIKEHDRCLSTRSYIGAKTKKMQARVKSYEKRIDREIEEKEGLLCDIEKTIELKCNPISYHKNRLIEGRHLSLTYEKSDKPVFEDLTFEINRGDRIFINGSNGCGKSTLIKAILKEKNVKIVSGELNVGSGLVISYINQDTSFLKGSLTEYCKKNALDESLLCAILRQLDMERTQFCKDMESFSQGQKKKVLIASSLMTPAHLYIWDEPLNYIDIFSRMQIESLIEKYKPTMLIVEHDVAFRKKSGQKR